MKETNNNTKTDELEIKCVRSGNPWPQSVAWHQIWGPPVACGTVDPSADEICETLCSNE